MADRIRISRRKEYREKLYLYLNLTKSLNAKLKSFLEKQLEKLQRSISKVFF